MIHVISDNCMKDWQQYVKSERSDRVNESYITGTSEYI